MVLVLVYLGAVQRLQFLPYELLKRLPVGRAAGLLEGGKEREGEQEGGMTEQPKPAKSLSSHYSGS